MPPRSKKKKPRSESEVSDEDEQVAVKSEPLDRSDAEDVEAASLPDDFSNFLIAADVVKVKIDSDDAEEDADSPKKRRSSLRRNKTPGEAEETSEKDEEPKRRKRRQKLRYRSDSDDDEDVDPEFTPSRRRRRSPGKAAKKKTPSRSPRLETKATATTEEEGNAGESCDGDRIKAKPKRKRKFYGRTRSQYYYRKRKSEMTPEELVARREKGRLVMQKLRASLSTEEIEKRRAIDLERRRMQRAGKRSGRTRSSGRKRVSEMTPEELAARREKWRLEMQKKRASLSAEEIEKRRAIHRERSRMKRASASLSAEEIEKRRAIHRERMRMKRAKQAQQGMQSQRSPRKRLSDMTPEERLAHRERKLQEQAQKRAMKYIQRMAEMTEEEKNQLRMDNYMRHVARMAKMTPEQKEENRRKVREKMKERYSRLTPEEKKRNNLVRNRVLENGLTKRENAEIQKMEKLKGCGDEWKAHVLRRRERKLQIKQCQELTGKKYVYHTHFLTPEDEALFKARKRLLMQRNYIKRKMTAAGASQEEIERKLKEHMEANPEPRKPETRKNPVPADFEFGKKSDAQTTPQSHQSRFSPETTVKVDGANATTSSNLHLSFNPFTMRWGATVPEPTRQEPNFSQNMQANAAPTATPSTSASYCNLNSLINPPPAHQQYPTLPNPNHIHQHQPHNDHQSFTESMDSANSSHYEYDNDDSFSDSFSPAPFAPQASAILPLPPQQPTNSGPTLKFTELRRESESSEVKPDMPSLSPPKKPSPERKNKTNNSADSEVHTIAYPSDPAKPIRPKKNITLPYRPPTRLRNSKCRVCGNHYSMKTLKEHMKDVHHPYFQRGFCTICGMRFFQPRDFHNHFKLHGGSGSVYDDTVTYTIPYDGPPPVFPPEPEKREPIVPEKPSRKRRRLERPLQQPTRYSSEERNCRCNECGNLYTLRFIKQHIRRMHHPYYQKKKCTICEEELRQPEHFFKHFREAHGDMGDVGASNVTYTVIPGPDGEIPKPPPSVVTADREEIGKSVLCDVCGNVYRACYISIHKRNFHPQHFRNGECTLCGEKFPKGPKYFMQHFKAVHVGKDVPKEPKKYKRGQGEMCQDCGKTCSNKHNLEEHWHYTHGPGSLEENFFKCTICPGDVRIKMLQSFNKHYRDLHPNEPIPGPYQCPYVFKTGCTMTYIQEKKAGEHIASQHPDLCFTCQYCHKAWAFEISLNFHYIKCLPMPREEFKKIRKQVGENSFDRIPVKCELCKAETTLSGLTLHYKTRHGAKESKFRCLKCGKTFKTRQFLAAHITDFHGLMPDEYINSLSKLNVTDRTGISVELRKITKSQREKKTVKKIMTKRLEKVKPTRKTPGRRSKKKVETSESEEEEEDPSQSEADVSKDQSGSESNEDDEATNDKVVVKKEILSDAEDGVLQPILKLEIEDSEQW